ncbi:MAG: hypothetical protein K2L72_00115, partial [Clostridia bacterium]|nr:hypothetical protein [Clostridia bacterium]
NKIMENKKYDALMQMKLNLFTILQLAFGAAAGAFLCGWLSCPQYREMSYSYYSGPFMFIEQIRDNVDYGAPNPYPALQLVCMLACIICAVCFFVFGALSEKRKGEAYEYFTAHRDEYETENYLAANGKYYRSMVNDYLKVNSCFYGRKGKVISMYKKCTGYLFYPFIVSLLAVPVCVIGYSWSPDQNASNGSIAIIFALASMLCWFAFVFYYLVVSHRRRSYKRYAVKITVEQLNADDYDFDEAFMNYIGGDAKLSARATKMQDAGQKGIVPYVFSEPVTAVLLGGMAIYIIVIVYIAAVVITVVSGNKGLTSTKSSGNAQQRQGRIVLYGGGSDRYEVNDYGDICKFGARTGFIYVSYTNIRAHETVLAIGCRLLL